MHWFSYFQNYCSRGKAIDLVHGPVDWVHGTMVHGWTCYVKLRPSKSRSMAGILKTEGLSHDLIVTVHVVFDGGRLSSEKEQWHALCLWRRHGRLPELRSCEAHGTTPGVQTLKRRWWSIRLLPEAKTRRGTAPRWLVAATDSSKLWQRRGGVPRTGTSRGWLKWVRRSSPVLNVGLVEGATACSNAATVRSGG
jgi:hypothetical protein